MINPRLTGSLFMAATVALMLVGAGEPKSKEPAKEVASEKAVSEKVAPDKVAEVETVLDRLEKHLTDEEGAALERSPEQLPAAVKTPSSEAAKDAGKVTRYNFPTAKVKGHIEEVDRLKELSRAVASLESEVESLSAEVQKTKQGLLEGAKVDNFIDIDARMPDSDKVAIKNLTVKLDGYEVYAISDSAGLWLPTRSVPLYAGPMKPGSHRLDVDVRLVLRHKNPLPLNADVYRMATKSFDINVPATVERKRWSVLVSPPEADKLNGHVDVTLEAGPETSKAKAKETK